MIRTRKYKLPYFVDGDLYSGSVDAQRFIAIDLILAGLGDMIGDGIIEGLDISDASGLQVNVSPGSAFINSFYSRLIGNELALLNDDSTNYIYALRNTNIIDGQSEPSNRSTISFIDVTAPSAPNNFQAVDVGERTINVSWDQNTESDISHYVLSRKLTIDTFYEELVRLEDFEDVSGVFSYIDSSLFPNTSYDYRVSAYDVSGNISSPSDMTVVTLVDTTPPENVSNLLFEPSDGRVNLTWNKSTSSDLSHYNVAVSELNENGVAIGTEIFNVGEDLYFSSEGLDNFVDYRMTVQSVDTTGNVSDGVSVVVSPETASDGVLDVSNVSFSVTNQGFPDPQTPLIAISWDASASSNISGYEIVVVDLEANLTSSPISVGNFTSFNLNFYPVRVGGVVTNKTFKSRRTYTIRIKTLNSFGDRSVGYLVKTQLPNLVPPPPVSNLIVSAGSGELTATWNEVDFEDFSHYEAYIWEVDDEPNIRETISYNDATGSTFTLGDDMVSLVASNSYPTGSWVDLENVTQSGGPRRKLFVDATVNAGDGVVNVSQTIPSYYDEIATIILTNPTAPEVLNQNEFVFDGLTNNTQYRVTVITVDNEGNKSLNSSRVAIPSAVSFVASTPQGVEAISSDKTITLNWQEVVPTFGYNIYKAPVPLDADFVAIESQFVLHATINDGTITQFIDFDQTNEVRYAYIVTSFNDLLEESDFLLENQITSSASESISILPPDSVSAMLVGDQVNLSWLPPGDITGIEGWKIYRSTNATANFELLVDLPFTFLNYIDTGLVDGFEYTYFITSFSNTIDIDVSLSSVPPDDSILLGTVVTESGSVSTITPNDQIVGGLKTAIEKVAGDFIKNHVHKALLSDEFSSNREDPLKINLSDDEIISDLTTSDFKTYTTQRDLQNDKIYIPLVNGVLINVLWDIDNERNSVVFSETLFDSTATSFGNPPFEIAPQVTLRAIGLKEVFGELDANLISNLDATKIATGRLNELLLPSISHKGRVRECANVQNFQLISRDNIFYDLSQVSYLGDVVTDDSGNPVLDDNGDTVRETSTLQLGSPTVFYDLIIVDDVVYGASNRGVLRSLDNGILWEDFTTFSDEPVKIFLQSNLLDGSTRYYVVSQRKVFVSLDNFTTFSELTGLSSISIIHDITEDDDNNIFIATDIGMFVYDLSANIEFNFTAANYILDGVTTTDFVSIIKTTSNDIVVSNSEGVYSTSDKGQSWTPLTSLNTFYNLTRYDGTILAVRNDGFWWQSLDEGVVWTRLNFVRGVSRTAAVSVSDNRLYFATDRNFLYTEDLINTFEVPGEFNELNSFQSPQAIHAVSKNDIFISFDNALYKFINGDTHLWASFTGVIPTIFKNGSIIKDGYYYDSINNNVLFEFRNNVNDLFSISTTYVDYQLPGRGWQDIDEPEGEIICFLNNEQLVHVSTDEDGNEIVSDSIISSDVEATNIETEISTDDDGNEVLTIVNKKYVFTQQSTGLQIGINSSDGTVDVSSSLNKFDEIKISILNISLLNEGVNNHDELQDFLSKADIGFDFDLSNVYLENLLQLGLSIEHNFLEQVSQLYPYALNSVIRSFNSHLINSDFFIFGRKQYDVFNSTVDYEQLSSNDNFLPDSLQINKIVEINGFTWLLTSSNIFELNEARTSINREVFIVQNSSVNVSDALVVNNLIYTVADNDIYTTDDNGSTWEINQGFGLPDNLLSIIILNNILVVGTNDAVYHAEQGSDTWSKAQINDLSGEELSISANVYSLIRDDIGYVLMDNRVFKSNTGTSWVEVFDFDSLGVIGSKLFPYKNTVLAITDNGLYTDNSTIRTLNNTATFTAIQVEPLSSTSPMRDIAGFGDTLLLVNSDNIYTSLDSGETFSKEEISDVFAFDKCHFWRVFGLTQSRIDFLESSSGLDCDMMVDNPPGSGLLTCSIITSLRTIEDEIYFNEQEYRTAIEGLLTAEQIRNFEQELFSENQFVNTQTQLFSFLNNLYNRDISDDVQFLLNTDKADYVFGNNLQQSVGVQGSISKISLFLFPHKLEVSNFDIVLNVYGGDVNGDIVTGVLDSDIISSSSILGPAWHNFRISLNNINPTLVLELTQSGGDLNNTVRWRYTVTNEIDLGLKNTVEVPYSYSYQIWRFNSVVDIDNQLLNTRPALQETVEPEFVGGVFDKTILDSNGIELDLNPAIINFDIDLSGSMTWNDHGRDRFTLIEEYASRLDGFYPGDLKYTLSTFGGLVIEDLFIEDTSASDDRLGVVFRLVRRDDTFPSDPEDGEVIGCVDPSELLCGTTLTTLQDDDIVPGTTYFYSLFNMRTETSYSEPVYAQIQANPRVIPLPISAANQQVIDVKQSIGVPLAEVDVGLRQINLEYFPIINFSSFYDSVRILRKPCFLDTDTISNHSDGDIIFEGPVVIGQNVVIDDFGGTNDFINGIEYCYAFYTINSDGNFCLPDNAVQVRVRIPQVWREWEFDSSFNATHIPAELLDTPEEPDNLSVEAGNGQNRLTWEEPSGGAEGYIVYANLIDENDEESKDLNVDRLSVSLLYADVPDDSITNTEGFPSEDFQGQAASDQIIYIGTDTSFIHRNLKNGVQYDYRVFSFNRVFTLSEGQAVGSATPSELLTDDFPPPKPTNFYAQIFNSEKIVLRWNAESPLNEVTLFFDDSSSMRSFALDQFGIPLPEIQTFNFQLLPSSWTIPGATAQNSSNPVTVEGSVFVLQGTDLLGTDRGDSERKVEVNQDLFEFSVDKSTLSNEINAQINLLGTNAELSLYSNLIFRTNVFFRVADPNSETSDLDDDSQGVVITTSESQEQSLQETDFVINSELLTINFRNPLDAGHFNIAPETQVVARKVVEFDSTTGEKSESIDYLPGVYVRNGQSYFGIIEMYWKDSIFTEDQIANANVNIAVFEKLRDEATSGGATVQVFSSEISQNIVPVSTALTVKNKGITRQFNTGQSEQENSSEEQDNLQLTTVAEYELPPSDEPLVLRVAAIIELDGYVIRRDIIVNYETVLQIDLNVSSPKSDGIDVTEQLADIYLGPPKFDERSEAPRIPIEDGVIVQWDKIKKPRTVLRGLTQVTDTADRPFYSTDIVPLQDGVYSLTRQGVARNVFFGPANDVEIGFCFEDGAEVPCFEQYTIKARVVFDGLTNENEGVISLSPTDSGNKYKFYMTNGGDSGFDLSSSALQKVDIPEIFADGESVVNLKIYADPLDPASGAGDPGLYFVQCLTDKNFLYIPLQEGQEVNIFSPDTNFNSDGEETSIITYKGTDYPASTISDINTVIEDGVIEYQFKINKFISVSCDEDKGGDELPVANDGCYGIYQPPALDIAQGEIEFKAESIISINGNNVKTRGGGNKQSGIPPVMVKLVEPLDIRFVEMRSGGIPISAPPNNGADESELIFEVTFAGQPLPEGVLVAFEVFAQAITDPNCPDEQAESLDQFADFSEAQIRELLGGFTSVSELLEQLKFDRFALTRTENGKSVVSTTVQPTLFKTDLSLSFVASVTYDKLGTVDRLKKASANLQFQSSSFNVYLNSVERYDVVSNTWTEIDSFNIERAGHFSAYDAVTGRLYVGGGFTLIGITSSVEEFTYDNLDKSQNIDGTYGKWRFQDPMNFSRAYSSSVVIGQNLYVIGGYGLKDNGVLGAVNRNEVYRIADDENESSSSSQSSSSTEESSYSSSSSSTELSSSSSDSSSSSSLSSNSSASSESSESSSSQSQDSTSSESSITSSSSSDGDTWDTLSPLPKNISHSAAVSIGTNIYVMSGIESFTTDTNTNETVVQTYNNALYKYDTLTNEWTELIDLGANSVLQRISPNAYVFGGKIYVLNGVEGIFDPGNIDTSIFNTSLIEIDVSDEMNIIITEVADINAPIDRYRAVSGVLNDELFVATGSGFKTVDNNGFIDLRASNTLSEVEILDLNTNTWNTYTNLERANTARYSSAGLTDDEFFYVLGGAGTGWPKGKLFLEVQLSSNTLRADGIQQISANVIAKDATGEPAPDDTNILLRGFVFIQPPETENANTVSDPFNQASTTSLITSFSDVVRQEQNASNRLVDRISIYPVLFSANEGGLLDGKASFILFERGEDPLNGLSDLLAFREGGDEVVGLIFDPETGDIVLPSEEPTALVPGQQRELYKIIVEATIDDPVLFGQTNTNEALAALDSRLQEQIFDDGFTSPTTSSNLVGAQPQTQSPSPTVDVFSDILWIPDVDSDYPIMEFPEFSTVIGTLSESFPIGGSPLWDSLVESSIKLKDESLLDIDKLMVTASDNEQNNFKNSFEESLLSVQTIDGFGNTPVFNTSFVINFPPSLASRNGVASTTELETLSTNTGGASFTLLDTGFIDPVVAKITSDGTGSIGRGTYTQVFDFGQSVLVTSVFADFDIFPGTGGGVFISYSEDGYNFVDLQEGVRANTVTPLELPCTVRFIKFKAFLQTLFINPDTMLPTSPPVFNSISFEFSSPTISYLYTNLIEANSWVRELYVTANANVPECSSVKIGMLHANHFNFDSYDTPSQPAVSEQGRIVTVDSSIRSVQLVGDITKGGNVAGSSRTFDEIQRDYIKSIEVVTGKQVLSISVIENLEKDSNGNITETGRTLVIFVDESELIVDSAPDYTEASDLVDVVGDNPTKNVTEGTVLVYNFMTSDDGFIFTTTYGEWTPGAVVNVYVNGLIVDPLSYVSFPNLGIVRFNNIQSPTDNFALEIIFPPEFRIGFKISNVDFRESITLDEFAYMYNTQFLSRSQFQNTPPTVSNLFVSPTTSNKFDAFTANYTYSSDNNRPEKGSLISWFLNDGIAGELANKVSWSASDLVGKELKDGDRIYFTVTPSDGEQFGAKIVSTSIALGVTPPSISDAVFTFFENGVQRTSPTSSTNITINYVYSDDQGRPEFGTTIQWFVNDEFIDFGETNKQTLAADETFPSSSNQEGLVIARGNLISAIVTVSNGLTTGTPETIEAVTVLNSAPVIRNANLSPDVATIQSVVIATYNFFDSDNDDDQSITRWFKNNVEQTQLEGFSQISSSNLRPGDIWFVEIEPFDGIDSGIKVRTNTIRIV